jgi:hypothetical protein
VASDRPVTIREKMTSLLVNHGLWPKEAAEVMRREVEAAPNELMRHRWDDPAEDYPQPLLVALWVGVRTRAVSYLKETKPEHFAIRVLEAVP